MKTANRYIAKLLLTTTTAAAVAATTEVPSRNLGERF
jgi:hypothetical protein